MSALSVSRLLQCTRSPHVSPLARLAVTVPLLLWLALAPAVGVSAQQAAAPHSLAADADQSAFAPSLAAAPDAPSSQTVTVPGMQTPNGLAVHGTNRRIYLTSRDNDTLYMLNPSTFAVLGQVAVGDLPWGVAVDTIANRVYVANFGSANVMVFDSNTLEPLATIEMDHDAQPTFVAILPGVQRVFVANNRSDSIAVIDSATNTVEKFVKPGDAGAWGLAVNPNLNQVYVTFRTSGTLVTLDGALDWEPQPGATFQPCGGYPAAPFGAAFNQTTDKLYLACAPAGDVDTAVVYDTAAGGLLEVTRTLIGGGGSNGGGVAVSRGSGSAFFTNSASDTVSIMSYPSFLVSNTEPTGDDPFAVAVDVVGSRVIVGNRAGNSLTVFADPYLPGAFSKSTPANAATGQPANPTLRWDASAGATSYEYCYDTTNNSSCGGSWTSTGSSTTASLSGLSSGTTYYWQVRARNAAGATDANTSAWWSFTTQGCYALTMNVNPPGGGGITPSLAPNCGTGYSPGANVQLTCNTNPGYTFVNWSGDLSGTTNPASLTMNGNKSVTCNLSAPTGVTLWMDPAATTIGAGQVFSVTIRAVAGSRSVDAVDLVIGFDRSKLRVVDAGGNESIQIIPGPALTTILANSANNSTGVINYSAGVALGGTPATGNFVVATIWLKAVAGSETTTPVQFSAGTDLFYLGNSVLGSTAGSTVTIRFISLLGHVSLQGRGTPPANNWLNFPLTVTLHAGSCSNPVGSPYSAATDAAGNFSIGGAPAGTYNVRVKNAHTLSNCRANVLLGTTTVSDFGTLLEGDANNDDCVKGADFSILASCYLCQEGQACWATLNCARADFNGDKRVAAADFSLLATNYNKCGPTTVTSVAAAVMAPKGTVDLTVAPATRVVNAGEVFAVALNVAANGQPVQAVDAQVTFDPQYLRVVDAGGNDTGSVEPGTALATVLSNSADNSQGMITYSAGQELDGAPPDGQFVLATVHFKLVAEPPSGTEIAYLPATDVFYLGDSVKGALYAGQAVTLKEKTYLPLLLR